MCLTERLIAELGKKCTQLLAPDTDIQITRIYRTVF